MGLRALMGLRPLYYQERGGGKDNALGGVDLLSGDGGGEGALRWEEWIYYQESGRGRDSVMGGVDLLSGEGGGEGTVRWEEWIYYQERGDGMRDTRASYSRPSFKIYFQTASKTLYKSVLVL